MVRDGPVGHVAAKDVSKLRLVGATDMRVVWLVLEFDAVELSASHDAFLLRDWHSFPLRGLVLPLLQQKDGAVRTGNSFVQQRCTGSIEQCAIFRAVDKAGEIAIVTVRPTRVFFR